MAEVKTFAKLLKKFAAESPPTILKMPPPTPGLPEGTFVPATLLNYIADCFLGGINQVQKGAPHGPDDN